ncbi:MAG TPA: phosphate ABC transporter permease PstA [Thermoanaerobaculia bacterium]|nr:phosphate ABC transporter permease PstA [Thermoanaerobaculia bacterium]
MSPLGAPPSAGRSAGRGHHPALGIEAARARLARRHARERRFRLYCRAAAALAVLFLVVLFGDVLRKGWGAFLAAHVRLEIHFDPEVLDPGGRAAGAVAAGGGAEGAARTALEQADYAALWRRALEERFPAAAADRSTRRELFGLVSDAATFRLRDMVLAEPSLVGTTRVLWLTADDQVDMLEKGHLSRDLPAAERRLSDEQVAWLDELDAAGDLGLRFNTLFFTSGDSREPEMAGVLGAAVGSAFTLLITLAVCFPLGVATAVYLEELAPKNRWTDLIEVNINNLAAVPSIVFGLLGLAVFLDVFGLPRSAPLVGGLVLSLMTLPILIIASRVALASVPPSIREAAYGLGATPLQTIRHHVLPLAMPGILTGTILGMARALGETAPLLMIGMVAFIVDVPGGPLEPATALPVQIFLWADSPERAFVEKTSGAILVLLAFLILMNGTAVWLRRRSERDGR